MNDGPVQTGPSFFRFCRGDFSRAPFPIIHAVRKDHG
jgi:hypothetical protein